MTVDDGRPGRRLLRHDERRGLGERRRGRRRGRCIAAHLPEIYSVEYADPLGADVKVRIPTPLRSYTDAAVGGRGRRAPTVGEVLADLDRHFPGIRFRMVDEQDRLRKHMKVFVNDEAVRDLATPLGRRADEVTIMQALSGG